MCACVLARVRMRALSVARRMMYCRTFCRLLAMRCGNNVSVGKNVMCSTVQSPPCDAGQEIECLLWNPTVHYRVHNSTLLVPVLSQFSNSLRAILRLSFRLHLNLPSVLFPSVLPTKTFIALLWALLQAKFCKYLSLKTRINLNHKDPLRTAQ
jgi:hypothetical protein